MSVDNTTLFDIGSITKVFSTTSVLARLVEKKQVDLNDKVRGFSLFELLTHSAGLKPWLPLYQQTDKTFSVDWISNAEKNKSVYSDLGFLLIREYLAAKFGNIESLFEKEVREPLKLKSTGYNPESKNKNIAATEFCHFRKKMIQGEVFDENTFSLGGVSTHAGLFSIAEDLVIWGEEWLKARFGKSKWLSKETALLFSTRTKNNWALGFDTKSESGSTLGNAFSKLTFGHLGYPGTSIWMDPETNCVVAFLTNRIHPSRLDERIKQIRSRVHEMVFKGVLNGFK